MQWDIPAIEARLTECYRLLSTNVDENVQHANHELEMFNSSPGSVEIWLHFYSTREDPAMRRYAAVCLPVCIRKVWNVLDPDTKIRLFETQLSLLFEEPDATIRFNLVFAVQLSMSDLFNEKLFAVMRQADEAGADLPLQIALMLAPLLPAPTDSLKHFVFHLLERGFASPNPETRVVALHFMMYSPGFAGIPAFTEKLPEFWEVIVDTLGVLVGDETLLFGKTAKLIGFAMEQKRFVVNPLPVLEKVMSLFTGNLSIERMSALCSIIQNICSSFPDIVLESGAFPEILRLFILVSGHLFEADSLLTMSDANFFEQTLTDLCKAPDVLEALWTICCAIMKSPQGQFVFVCSLAATIPNHPAFYAGKLNEITELVVHGITSRSRLLCDAAARTADIVVKFFGMESEVTQRLISVVFQACVHRVSPDLLLVFTSLLDTTKDSEQFFDDAFSFLMNMLLSGPLEIKAAALPALASLSAGSTVRITVHFETLDQTLKEILQSTNASVAQLKAPALECLVKAGSATGDLFIPYVEPLCSFCMANLNNEDTGFAAACFESLEEICQSYPNAFAPLVPEIAPVMCNIASTDVFSAYKSDVARSIEVGTLSDGVLCDDLATEFRFVSSAVALRVLSLIVKIDKELCHKYAVLVIQCCELQKESVVSVSKSAAAFAIGNLAEALVKCLPEAIPTLQQLPTRMGHVCLGILQERKLNSLSENEAGLISDGFTAAAEVVEWLDYESLGGSIKPLLDRAHSFLVKISKVPSYTVPVRNAIESIYNFLNMFMTSAESKSPILLQDFMILFMEFTNHPDMRFKSLAMRFFADILSVASESLDTTFKANATQFALIMANEEGDRFAFAYLRVLAQREKEMAHECAPAVYEICMKTLSQEVTKTEKFLLMRDNCVLAFASFALNVFESLNLEECLPPVLGALPLVIDFSEVGLFTDFFKWAYEKAKDMCPNLFVRVLIVLFANPSSVTQKMGFSDQDRAVLLAILKELLGKYASSDEVISSCLDGDSERKKILESLLSCV